jgi:translation initiation factor RLI1
MKIVYLNGYIQLENILTKGEQIKFGKATEMIKKLFRNLELPYLFLILQ